MSQPNEYRQFFEMCCACSESASEKDKEKWLELAEFWRRKADNLDGGEGASLGRNSLDD